MKITSEKTERLGAQYETLKVEISRLEELPNVLALIRESSRDHYRKALERELKESGRAFVDHHAGFGRYIEITLHPGPLEWRVTVFYNDGDSDGLGKFDSIREATEGIQTILNVWPKNQEGNNYRGSPKFLLEPKPKRKGHRGVTTHNTDQN